MAGLKVDHVRLGQARLALRSPLSQVDASRRLGVHPVTLNRIENGKANVSLDLLERICELYGRSREWLLGEPEQVDQVEQSRQQVGAALAKIAAGFEELTEVLDGRVREAAAAQVAA